MLVICQVDSFARKTAYSSHSAASLSSGVNEQRSCHNSGIWDARKWWEKRLKKNKKKICFLQFLVAQFLCSSFFTVLEVRRFHFQRTKAQTKSWMSA